MVGMHHTSRGRSSEVENMCISLRDEMSSKRDGISLVTIDSYVIEILEYSHYIKIFKRYLISYIILCYYKIEE